MEYCTITTEGDIVYVINKPSSDLLYTITILTDCTSSTEEVLGYAITKLSDTKFLIAELPKDGHFKLYHLVVEDKENSGVNKLCVDGDKIYFREPKAFIEMTVEDIISSNQSILHCTNNTSTYDLFNTTSLKNCLANKTKASLSSRMSKCNAVSQTNYERDFILATVHIIDYYMSLGKPEEALRILEEVNGCGGFCSDSNYSSFKYKDCGCK